MLPTSSILRRIVSVSLLLLETSNIMVDRITGGVVHIDFADCFEVAMQRDKFPERVPFRLTRMLVNAMEVGLAGVCLRRPLENVLW